MEGEGDGGKTPEGGTTVTPQDAPPPPRQNLVELAVKFLNNPRVAERAMEDKKAFLRKKGLTDTEIDTAIAEASQQQPHPTMQQPAASNGNAPPLPPRPLTPLHHHPAPPPRSWSEYAIMAALVGGVGYAIIHFIKNYVIPWFNAPRAQEMKQLEDIHASVNQLQTTVSETVATVAQSTKSIQELLAEQQQHLQLLTSQVTGLQASLTNDQPLRQLKEELGSLKGIMLSRHQFPPTPTRGGSVGNGGGIPAWQRAAVPQDTVKKPVEQDGENGFAAEENGNGTVVQNGIADENSLDES